MRFWRPCKEARHEIQLKRSTVAADGDAPILRWWGIPAACPADIRSALAENPGDEEFVLEINSGGGSVFAGFEMYSLLRNASRQGVHTGAEVQSLAGSAASVVMAGAETAALLAGRSGDDPPAEHGH